MSTETQPIAAVLGGEPRQTFSAQALQGAGWQVNFVELKPPAQALESALQNAKLVLCPKEMDLPLLQEYLTPQHTVVGVMLPTSLKKHCAAHGIPVHDLLDREDFTRLNAIPTAEGAIAEAIAASNVNLHLSQALVLGYGRCGNTLARKLQGMGARVTVAARRWDSACAAIADGCEVLDFLLLPRHMPRFPFVFNTIPAPVLGLQQLQGLPPEAVVIDIASAPGGVDFEAAKQLGIAAKLCPGLPGKYSPRSAGEAAAQVARIILEEQEASEWGWNKSASESA